MAKKKRDDVFLLRQIVHLLGLFTLFIGPLILYFVREEKAIRDETTRVLNWQFSLLIYLVIAALIQEMLFFSLFLNLHNVLIVINIILSIIGFVKVSNHERFEYPLAIQFFKQ